MRRQLQKPESKTKPRKTMTIEEYFLQMEGQQFPAMRRDSQQDAEDQSFRL